MNSLWLSLFLATLHALPAADFDADRDTKQMAEARGYPCERLTATTLDGYVLGVFRIPGRRGESLSQAKLKARKPVVIQHGFVCSSDDFFANETPSLIYVLADAGFDVWLPNLRGNRHSRRHVKLDPNEGPEFWNFTIDHVIKYDLRAIVELILRETKHDKVSLLGYSMGGGVGFAAACRDPEFYGRHLSSYIGLAPSTRSLHSIYIMKLAHYLGILHLLEFFGLNEIMNFGPTAQWLFSELCKNLSGVCEFFIAMFADKHPDFDNSDRYGPFFAHYPSGTSIKQAMHMIQLSTQENYTEFRWHEDDPVVAYDFYKFPKNVPVAILGGTDDMLVDVQDTRWLKDIMEKIGVLKLYREYSKFGHLTFLLPKKVLEPYYDILMFFKQH